LEAQEPGFHPTGRGFRVLVVDDDRVAAENLCALLRIWGYQSEACDDVIDGLQLTCELSPDCLVVDIDMPGLVGHALAQELRVQPDLSRVKLVALSFHADDPYVQFSRESGFDFHFAKPMTKLQVQRLKALMHILSERVQLGGEREEPT
jgi:CheY-like chemotaxis protein